MTNEEKAKRLATRIEGYPDRASVAHTDNSFNPIDIILDEEVCDTIADAFHLTDRLPDLTSDGTVHIRFEGRVFDVSTAVAEMLEAALENYTTEVEAEEG